MKVTYLVITSFFLALLESCNLKPEVKEEIKDFQAPVIINTSAAGPQKKAYFTANHVQGSNPVFAGKFKFNDTIDVNPDIQESLASSEYFSDYSFDSLPDSLDTNGLSFLVDYQKEVYYTPRNAPDSTLYSFYPVYLINSTKSYKLFLGKDAHGYGIQEARDTSDLNHWTPIEGKGFDFCGNGTWALMIKPGEFVVLLMKEYHGSLETPMKVRIANGESIYVSRAFKGRVNPHQFNLPKDPYLKKTLLMSASVDATDNFYGAQPKQSWFTE